MYVAAKASTPPLLEKAAADLGLTFTGVAAGAARRRAQAAAACASGCGIATADRAASGWMRWLLERYEFPFEVVYAQTLDAGDLASEVRRD